MYKTAPRYLSGVSVFYGDDVSKRALTGEIAFFVGQAIKGPSVPVVLSSIDAAVLLYGKDSPILKGLYEFWDGYIDSPKSQQLQLITMRLGGQAAKLTTNFGVTITTADAYTGIEDDFYVYINNTAGATVIKAWDSKKQKVLDTANGIDSGYLIITGALNGLGGIAGKDIDSDPYDTAYTLKTVMSPSATPNSYLTIGNINTTNNLVYDATSNVTFVSYTVTDALVKSEIPINGGWLIIQSNNFALNETQYFEYTSATINGNVVTFAVTGKIAISDTPWINSLSVSLFNLMPGDSELTNDPRKRYEVLRNGLLELEQFTPDYIVPCGFGFNETDTFYKTITLNTTLTAPVQNTSTSLLVDGAANWLAAGNVDLFDGSFSDQLVYSSKVINGADYTINLDLPTGLVVTSLAASGATTFSITGTAAQLAKLRTSGFLKVGSDIIKYTNCVVAGNGLSATITRDLTAFSGQIAGGASITKVPTAIGSGFSGYIVRHSFTTLAKRELGIGYVKETDIGGSYTFDWSDTPKVGYGLAHFGYVLAKFCDEATIESNTPLCGMNVDISAPVAAGLTRASIVEWVGTYPSYVNVPGTDNAVSGVLASGSGLLGDPVMAGSYNYNRSSLSDPSSGTYTDPGLGLLLTSEGFIDGTIVRDNFGKIVDLGKYMVVGAGLLLFNNGASILSYTDACGIYALGMLAGKDKSGGLSFSQIGTVSNTSVGTVVHRKYYNDLARMKFIVITREHGLGWVVNNADSAARTDSEYKLISTTRVIKYIVENKRSVLSNFIGKPLNTYSYEAAKTKLAESFKQDIKDGLLNGYAFDLTQEDAGIAIGKLYLKIAINPPYELTQVVIDTIIDRTVTNK
jgi:hypothetical protein